MVAAALAICAVPGQASDVTGKIRVTSQQKKADSSGIVISLTPLNPSQSASARRRPVHATLTQKDKTFLPHILVIPPGSSVDFPNKDPFFHNVFSLFEGKRFDLGLYESGVSRTVRFERPGVSYIFCNIHPQMNAIVIALDTPYYALVNADGLIRIRDVPPGTYSMQIWGEGLNTEEMKSLSRRVTVTGEPLDLGTLEVSAPESLASHKNKYGRDYDQQTGSPYQPH